MTSIEVSSPTDPSKTSTFEAHRETEFELGQNGMHKTQRAGHASWISDLVTAIECLPFPTEPIPTFESTPGGDEIDKLIKAVKKSIAIYFRNMILSTEKFYLVLRNRKDPDDDVDQHMTAALKLWHYLRVANPKASQSADIGQGSGAGKTSMRGDSDHPTPPTVETERDSVLIAAMRTQSLLYALLV
ncbi:hypothetical protein CC2G_013581 [Coprinopsis cinerea AmutBmut pab1-1]|nr:hypothetical protein CC2G_013581 [Coprinopsis cinerea AmutBmut pab1-1]